MYNGILLSSCYLYPMALFPYSCSCLRPPCDPFTTTTTSAKPTFATWRRPGSSRWRCTSSPTTWRKPWRKPVRPRLYLGTEREAGEARAMLENYLGKHFSIEWNGEQLAPELFGWELADDLHGLWLYLAVPVREGPREVTIQNTVLTEHYADQKNIVKLFEASTRRATLLLSRNQPEETYVR